MNLNHFEFMKLEDGLVNANQSSYQEKLVSAIDQTMLETKMYHEQLESLVARLFPSNRVSIRLKLLDR